jgi:cell division protein FtsX
MKLDRGRLVAAGIGVAIGVAGTFAVDAYRNWSLERQCAEQDRRVAIFLRNDATPEEVETVEQRLSEHPGVESFEHVSQEEAYEEFRELYEDQPHLYETITADDLPASFRIVAKDEGAAAEVWELDGLSGVDTVRPDGDDRLRLKCNRLEFDRDPLLNP